MPLQKVNPLHVLLALLLLAGLACRLPDAGLTTPTSPALTLVTPATASPSATIAQPPSPVPATARPTSPPLGVVHRIAIHRIYGLAEFYDRTTTERFIPRGVNYFLLMPEEDHYEDRLLATGIYDPKRVQADFASLAGAGYNTVRILLDGCSSGGSCLGIQDGQGLNPAYLDNLADLLSLAKANNLFVLLGIQGLPELGGYREMAAQGSNASFGAGINAQLLTKQGIQASQQFWSDLLSGLAARQAAFDTILGWELVGEQYFQADQPPFSLQRGRVTLANNSSYDMARPSQREDLAVNGLRYYIDQVKQTILQYDPSALVTMGFLTPDSPNPWREGDNRYVVTASLLGASSLDFFDLHASPGRGLTMAQLAENYGLGEHASVPVVMGEVGASTWTYSQPSQGAIAVQDWIAASCAQGFSGWIYNGYNAFPAGLANATWGLVDEQGALLKALSPKGQPDACATTSLPGRNLALNKPVQVSAALPDQTPEMAVDGNTETQWSAGDFPTQWIEIDLGAAYSIGEIRLTVGQWPEGSVVHQVWVGTTRDDMQQVDEFSGYMYDYDVLTYQPERALQNIRYVRIVTVESPSWVSWREIEVLAAFPATPTPVPTATVKVTPTP